MNLTILQLREGGGGDIYLFTTRMTHISDPQKKLECATLQKYTPISVRVVTSVFPGLVYLKLPYF